MARSVDKGHGRLEIRTLRVTGILTKQQDTKTEPKAETKTPAAEVKETAGATSAAE